MPPDSEARPATARWPRSDPRRGRLPVGVAVLAIALLSLLLWGGIVWLLRVFF